MAEDSPSTNSSTRWVETTQGILSYTELAPLLGERVLRVQQVIEDGGYSHFDLCEDLLQKIHFNFCGDLVPDWAGKWRTIHVRVGAHNPPPPHEVALHVRNYMADLREQTRHADVPKMPELLAFAEGRLLTIHPFSDFNGRVTRLWLWELLRRFTLPPVSLAPKDSASQTEYIRALRAADIADFEPLTALWRDRIAKSPT